jgi:hypothetical protein
MHSRAVSLLALAGVALAGSVVFATAASASVRFDPDTGTGFIDKSDVEAPFGWSDAILQARAAGVSFMHSKGIEDFYSVVCGWDTTSTGARDHITLVVPHYRQALLEHLSATIAYDASTANPANPKGRIAGFRLTGSYNGISATTARPMVGAGCPEDADQAGVKVVDAVRLLSSSTTSTVTASFKGVAHDLLVTRS